MLSSQGRDPQVLRSRRGSFARNPDHRAVDPTRISRSRGAALEGRSLDGAWTCPSGRGLRRGARPPLRALPRLAALQRVPRPRTRPARRAARARHVRRSSSSTSSASLDSSTHAPATTRARSPTTRRSRCAGTPIASTCGACTSRRTRGSCPPRAARDAELIAEAASFHRREYSWEDLFAGYEALT